MNTNPKQEGTRIYSCRVQTGKCPNGCNQCYYNHDGYYENINEPHIPDPAEVNAANGIVRMNDGHDSSIEKERVIFQAEQYNDAFFNTSRFDIDFPGPVVLTANAKEEDASTWIQPYALIQRFGSLSNVMFVRYRTSVTNYLIVALSARKWAEHGIPVVLTFMRYYSKEAMPRVQHAAYEKKTHVLNSYYCPTKEFIQDVLKHFHKVELYGINMCGSIESSLCKDCMLCEHFYRATKKRMMS